MGSKTERAIATVRCALLCLLAAGVAHADSGYVYAKIIGGATPFAYAPFSLNPTGPINVQRTGTGVDVVTFTNSGIGTGWVALANAAGSNPGDYCNVKTWSASAVTVDCYGPGGTAADTSYVVFAISNTNDKGINFAWDQNYAANTSSPPANYSYNPSGPVTFTNAPNGAHATFSGLGATGGTFEVDAVNSNAACNTNGWTGSAAVIVTCYDSSGNQVESSFVIAIIPAGTTPTGLAYTYEDAAVVTLPNTPSGPTYNSAGYAALLQRQSTGKYQVFFYGLSSVPVGGPGFMMATADGSSARCNGNSWGQFGSSAAYVANVYCYDGFGNPVDSNFEVLVLPAIGYAYASISNPSGGVNQSASINPGGGVITGTHLGTGSYQVYFPNSGIGPGWAAQAISKGTNFCNVSGWGNGVVGVLCYSPAGKPADSTFAVLAVSNTNQESIAFAWAGQPSAASYAPDAHYAYNPSGSIAITRNSIGFYLVDFSGLDGNGGTVQVAAYGSSPTTCTSAGWTTPDFQAKVACYDINGAFADSAFAITVISAGGTPPDFAYVWADAPASASYTPPVQDAWDASGTVTVTRSGTGSYHPNFPGATAFLQATPYNATARCAAANTTSVQCYTMPGAAVDEIYSALAISAVPSVPGSLVLHAGNNQSAQPPNNFPSALSVLVTNLGGNPLPGAFVTFTAPTSGAYGTFADPLYEFVSTVTVASDSNGVATAPAFQAQGSTGAYTVLASMASYPGGATPVSFTLTNVPPTAITLQTSPAGLQVSFGGSTFAAAPETVSFMAGTSQTVVVKQTQAAGTGTQYLFTSWSDGGGATHFITVPASNETLTATFKTQYQFSAQISPTGTGSVGASGSYFDANSNAAIIATPLSGFRFVSWTGSVANTANASTTIAMSAPESATAHFARTCAITNDINASVNDVQAIINQALGKSTPTSDLNSDGRVNLVDMQIVIRAVMSGVCTSF